MKYFWNLNHQQSAMYRDIEASWFEEPIAEHFDS